MSYVHFCFYEDLTFIQVTKDSAFRCPFSFTETTAGDSI